jgi:Tol biopolymer transport system component
MLPFMPRQLTSAPGVETDPAVSPDGTLVAYAAEDRGHFDLWVVSSRGGNPIRLTNDEDSDRSPAWFPDGSAIAFVSTRGGREGVWKIPALGGTPTLVMHDASAPAISPDGKQVAFVRNDENGNSAVFVAPIDTPDRAVAAAPKAGGWGQYTPSWAPDGKRLAFADFNNIWVVDLADHESHQVTDGPWGDLKPVWTTDGDIVFTSEARGGTRALWRVGADGRQLRRLTSGSSPERLASIGKRGEILAYTTFAPDTDIGIVDRVSGSFSRFGAQRGDFAPTLSQDGRRVFFTSERWGAGGCLAAQDLDGVQPKGETRRVLERRVALSRLSPNGEWVAYWRPVDGERDIWIARSNGSEDNRLDDDPANDLEPAWSPRGDRIAFVSERGGASQIWVADVTNGRLVGKPRRLTTTTGSDLYPEWSPDGREILFSRSDGTSSDLWSVGVDGTGERRMTRGAGALVARWPAGSKIVFLSGTWGSSNYELRTVDPVTGASQPLDPPAVGTADVLTGQFDVAMGGRIVALTLAESRGDIWIMAGDAGSF